MSDSRERKVSWDDEEDDEVSRSSSSSSSDEERIQTDNGESRALQHFSEDSDHEEEEDYAMFRKAMSHPPEPIKDNEFEQADILPTPLPILRAKSTRNIMTQQEPHKLTPKPPIGGIPKSASETNLSTMRQKLFEDDDTLDPRMAASTTTPPIRLSSTVPTFDTLGGQLSSRASSSSLLLTPSSTVRKKRAGSIGSQKDDAKSIKGKVIQEIKSTLKPSKKNQPSTTFSKGAALREKIFKQANTQNEGLNPLNKLYKPIFRKDFLVKHVNRLETSIKVLTTIHGGDIFVGSKQTCEAVGLDLDLLNFGGRKWGGGNGALGEGIVKLDFVEIEALKETDMAKPQQFKRSREEPLFWEAKQSLMKQCQMLVTRRGNKSLTFWIIYMICILVMLTAALATGIERDVTWDGFAAWNYFLFALLFLIIPLIAYTVSVMLARVLRAWANVAKRRNKSPESLQDFLSFVFVFEMLSGDITIMFSFFFYTISFLAMFAAYPPNSQVWTDAYKYTTCTFGVLCLYFLGRVITQAVTQAITRNVDLRALGKKVRNVLRREQALWEILQVTPNQAEESMFTRMEDPFLLFDPRMADHLAKGLIRTQFSGKYTQIKGGTVEIVIDKREKAGLLGSWVYQSLMRRSTTSTRGTTIRRYDSNTRRRGGSGDSSTRRGRMGSNDSSRSKPTRGFDEGGDESRHYSPLPQRGSFVSLLNAAKARHGGNSATAQAVFPELDLCTPFNHRIMNLFGDAINAPARRIGTVRGCAKSGITINDVALCLERPEETLEHTWFDFLDSENQEKIDLRRVRDATIGLVSDRINLKATLESNAKVKARLGAVISVLVNFIVILISLAIYGLNVYELWLSMSSVVLAFSFIFGGTLKNIFDSAVFLFGVHPYDIGDKIKLGATETPYWIDEIALMSTRMLRWDGSSVEFLNSYLYTAVNLVNVNRSSNHSIVLQIRVDAASVPKQREMDKIRTELEEFLSRSSAFTGECTITCREIIYPLTVQMAVWVEFAYNDINSGRTFNDTSRVILFLISTLKKRKLRVSGVNSGAVDISVGSVRLAQVAQQQQPPPPTHGYPSPQTGRLYA